MSPRKNTAEERRQKSIVHAANKRLLYEVIHLQWQPDILCSNDAK